MLVLLDRDGVINQDRPDSVTSLAEWEWIPNAADAIVQLKQAGFRIALATNQSAVGRGLMSQRMLDTIHEHMQQQLTSQGAALDAIFSCIDHPDQPTPRRKPGSGMLQEALTQFGANAADTPMVGDALRDLQAAAALGCPRYLVQTGKGAKTLTEGLPSSLQPVEVVADLMAAAQHIIARYGARA